MTTLLNRLMVSLIKIAARLRVRACRKSLEGWLGELWPVAAQAELLADGDRALYQRRIPPSWQRAICAQVLGFRPIQLSQLIANSFKQRSLYFLILNSDTSTIAVELEDGSHVRKNPPPGDVRKGVIAVHGGVIDSRHCKQSPDSAARPSKNESFTRGRL